MGRGRRMCTSSASQVWCRRGLFLLTLSAGVSLCLPSNPSDQELSKSPSPRETCTLKRVAVLIPASPFLHHTLKEVMLQNARRLMHADSSFCVHVFMDGGPLEIQAEDERPLSKTARLRNRMIDSLNLTEWDYILWIDADVVEYPADLPSLLIRDNPHGVTAPLVLVEEPGPRGPNQFYDTTAFTLKGRSGHAPNDTSAYVSNRSVDLFYPYVPYAPGQEGDLVDMDGVGTVYMVPAHVFREGARYVDHKCLTEHWSVISRVHDMGLPVKMHRGITVRHALLPKYGHDWHSNTLKA